MYPGAWTSLLQRVQTFAGIESASLSSATLFDGKRLRPRRIGELVSDCDVPALFSIKLTCKARLAAGRRGSATGDDDPVV
jgi:hypothetical protein